LQHQLHELQRLLGKKTLENEILREALDLAQPKNGCCGRPYPPPLPRSTRRGFVATSVARRGRFFHFATLERDRLPAADEPDEALKRSLRELIVDDRGLIAFLSRHARR